MHDRRYVRSFSRSSSLDIGPLRISIEEDRPLRVRSPSIEVVERIRYIDDPPVRRPRYVEETVFLRESNQSRRRRVNEDEDYDADLDQGHRRR